MQEVGVDKGMEIKEILLSIGLVVGSTALSYSVKRICRKYMEGHKGYDDK